MDTTVRHPLELIKLPEIYEDNRQAAFLDVLFDHKRTGCPTNVLT